VDSKANQGMARGHSGEKKCYRIVMTLLPNLSHSWRERVNASTIMLKSTILRNSGII
jgi:hypothetical protein